MSDSNVETLEENEENEKKEEEENVVINIEPKRKPRKKMSAEDHAAMLERLKRGREAAHAKRRALESTVKMKKIEKLQDEIDKAQNDPIIKTNKKEYKEQKEEDEVKDIQVVKKKKKKKVIIEESDSSEEEIIVRRKSKSRSAVATPPPPPPPAVARRPPPTPQERAAVIERAEAARIAALQLAQNKARQDQMMKSIFG